MLRLVLLALYLAGWFSPSPHAKIGGGLDPDGFSAPAPPPSDGGGGWDPDGLTAPAPPPAEIGGGWDPNG